MPWQEVVAAQVQQHCLPIADGDEEFVGAAFVERRARFEHIPKRRLGGDEVCEIADGVCCRNRAVAPAVVVHSGRRKAYPSSASDESRHGENVFVAFAFGKAYAVPQCAAKCFVGGVAVKVAATFCPAFEGVADAVTVAVDGGGGRAVADVDGIFDDVDAVDGCCGDGGKRVGRYEVVGIDKGDKFSASKVDTRIACGAQSAVLAAMYHRHATV